MPSSAIASTATGLTWSAGCEPADRTSIRSPAEVPQVAGGHLGAAGVVDADEQDGGAVLAVMRWLLGSRAGDGVEQERQGEPDARRRRSCMSDERRRRDGRDAGERVGERAGDGDRRVGEAGGAGEPVRRGDVAADRERDGLGRPERRLPKITSTRPRVATTSPSSSPPPLRSRVDDVTASRSNIRLACTHADHAARELGEDRAGAVAGRHQAERALDER